MYETGSMNVKVEPIKVPQITSSLANISQAIDSLSETIGKLSDRLHSVKSPVTTGDMDRPRPNFDGHAPLAMELDTQADRIWVLDDEIKCILVRLEI